MTAPAAASKPQSAEIARLFAAADAARARGDTAAALAGMERVLGHDPANPRALNALGLAAQARGNLDRAAELLARATAADPSAPELWLNLAGVARARDDASGERVALTQALAADPAFVPARLLRGHLTERTGNPGGAAADYGLALAQLPAGAQLPPGLAALVDHARAALAVHGSTLAGALDPVFAGEGPLPPRFQRLIDTMTGRNRVHRSQPAGLDFPELPAIEFFDRALFPWFAELEAATAVIRSEYLALFTEAPETLEPYVAYQPGEPVNQWAALNHSTAWGVRFLMRDGVARPDVRSRCPQTAALVDRLPLLDLPGRGPSIFFSVLAPHTRIPAHWGSTNLRSIVHLGLIVPPGCGFRVGGATREWHEGKAFAFDDTIEHEAWNDSGTPRVVLILDTWNPALTERERELTRRLVATADGLSFNDT